MRNILSPRVIIIIAFSLLCSFIRPAFVFAVDFLNEASIYSYEVQVDDAGEINAENEQCVDAHENVEDYSYADTEEISDTGVYEIYGYEDEAGLYDEGLEEIIEEVEELGTSNEAISIHILLDFQIVRVWQPETLSYVEQIEVVCSDTIVTGDISKGQVDKASITLENKLPGIILELRFGDIDKEEIEEDVFYICLSHLSKNLYLQVSGNLMEAINSQFEDDDYQMVGMTL